MTRLRTLPPAGTAISIRNIVAWIAALPRARTATDEFRERLRETYDVDDVHLLSSCRAAMTLLLEAVASTSRKEGEAIVPGYTCYSVAAAVIRAGLRVRPVDVDPDTLDYDYAALGRVDTTNVAVAVSANLFGIPNDLERLERFAKTRSILMIDDAAQAMHARTSGRFAGTFGDAGILSLDKGKNITTIEGGVLFVRNAELARRLAIPAENLSTPGPAHLTAQVGKLIAYSLLLRPSLYGSPSRVLPLGQTPFDTSFPIHRYPSTMAPMADRLFRRIQQISAARIERAKMLLAATRSIFGFPSSPPLGKFETGYWMR